MTLIGRIQLVKTFGVPQMTYMAAVTYIPELYINQINDIIFNFIWLDKPPKIKRKTIIGDTSDGGLKMIDFKIMNLSLKAAWIKRFTDAERQTDDWQIIPLNTMSKFGQLLVFESNIDTNTINMENVEPFYQEILVAWSKLQIEKKITTKEDILNEIIWNNKHMLINGKAMFYKEWFNKGIKYIKYSIHENGHFLTTDEINNKYRIAVNIMTYNSIKASIPNKWRRCLKNGQIEDTLQNRNIKTNILKPKQIKCKNAHKILKKQEFPQ